MINNVTLDSGVQQVIQLYIYILFHSCIYIHILFHYRSLQDTEYSSLCYTVGPCCLCILYMYAYVNFKLLIYPSPTSCFKEQFWSLMFPYTFLEAGFGWWQVFLWPINLIYNFTLNHCSIDFIFLIFILFYFLDSLLV